MRPDPPFYVGATRPGTVGWTRIAVTLVAGLLIAVLLIQRSQQGSPLVMLAFGLLFGLLALWSWMRQWTRFIVDERGLTVSLGGFLPQRAWPLEDFRTVQLRELPASGVGVTVGGYGFRRGRAVSSTPEQLRPVAGRKVHTTGRTQERYQLMVTRPGTMVEIISRSGDTQYLISPVDPDATAAAVDQAIRARR